MLFRLPTVAGPGADPGTRTTTNRFCEAAVTLAYGERPWEPYLRRNQMMVFDSAKSGLVQTEGTTQCGDLTRTQGRRGLFKTGVTSVVQQAIQKANQ